MVDALLNSQSTMRLRMGKIYLGLYILGYIYSFMYPGTYGFGYLLGLLCITNILFPGRARIRSSETYDRSLDDNADTNRPRYNWFEIAGFALLPSFVFLAIKHFPLPWDSLFDYTAEKGAYVQFFPGFYLIILYILPLAYRMGVKKENVREIGFHISGMHLLFIILALAPLIVRSIIFYPEIIRANANTGTREALFMAAKAYYQPGFWEELYYRAFLFAMLRTRLNFGQSIIVSAVLFAAMHTGLVESSFSGDAHALYNTLSVLLMGAVLAFVYEKTKSIIPCMLYHGTIVGINYIVIFVMRTKWGV